MSAQPKELRDYQRRAQRLRQRDARRKVREFKAWIRAGCPPGKLPELPTSADFKAAER